MNRLTTLIAVAAVIAAFILIDVMFLAGRGGRPWPCLKELCKGEVTLAALDYTTAKCEADGVACEFFMPPPHTFSAIPASAQGCVRRARCGRGDSCSLALASTIRNHKNALKNERTNLLAGSNNRCVATPSSNPPHPCTWTDPAPLPDPVYTANTPEATCTNNGCGTQCIP